VIIRNIIPDQTAQMIFIEDDHVIEELSAAASNPAFRDSILPRASEACLVGYDATGYQQIHCLLAKLRISIQNRVSIGTKILKMLLAVAALSSVRLDAR
jgi:hypothetical protein